MSSQTRHSTQSNEKGFHPFTSSTQPCHSDTVAYSLIPLCVGKAAWGRVIGVGWSWSRGREGGWMNPVNCCFSMALYVSEWWMVDNGLAGFTHPPSSSAPTVFSTAANDRRTVETHGFPAHVAINLSSGRWIRSRPLLHCPPPPGVVRGGAVHSVVRPFVRPFFS